MRCSKFLLMCAAKCGNIEVMRSLLKKGEVKISDVDSNKTSAILHAAKHGHLSAVQWLLNEGSANIFDSDDDHRTVLLHAASKGHLDLVQWLVIFTKVDLLSRDAEWRTPMLAAAFYGHISIVQWLLAHAGAKISETTHTHRETALMLAASRGHFKMVKWLLKEGGAKISEIDRYGESVLAIAVGYNVPVIQTQKFGSATRAIDYTGYIGNEAMILWFLQEEYVNAHEVWIAIGKFDEMLVMYSDSETGPRKPSLLLVSLLLMMDMPACFDQLYRRQYRELVDAACTRATILRAKKSGWLVKQKESIVNSLDGWFPKELELIIVEYSHPSVYEIWFELEIDAAAKKKRRRVSNKAPPRRNPDRAARKKYA